MSDPLSQPSRAALFGLTAVALALVWFSPASAEQDKTNIVPDNWQGDALRPKPDMKNLEKIRFVTDSDYPPFHYYDEVGALTGFNVDLAKAICEVLEVQCEVNATNWSDLIPSLDKGEADAAIASIRITKEVLQEADFTSRYYATPARFVARKESELTDVRPETIEDLKIGVATGTGHEAYLKTFFPDAAVASFDTPEDAQKALKNGAIDLIFGDGISLTFWINGVTSEACCEFRGGPYIEAKFFGEGVGIAVKKGDRKLADILTYGLEQVHASGRYEELFLRYFPMSFF
ncbi:MAG: transporter substrate-binding domain-containing protein [Methyloceanibacter sp.]|uniref:transporter substrate-binding domain-containing protein n=1 Tax=Methyloceanibacter sp. TaxID=1965321 RepID=UPI003D6C797C